MLTEEISDNSKKIEFIIVMYNIINTRTRNVIKTP